MASSSVVFLVIGNWFAFELVLAEVSFYNGIEIMKIVHDRVD